MEEKQLRHGYTTGATATAATRAALVGLIEGKIPPEVTIQIPTGDLVRFEVVDGSVEPHSASAVCIKDGGDDPDATHGARIVSTVSFQREGITLDGGIGVGRVSKPGLPVPIGEAAINPVPRKMIREVAQETLQEYGVSRGVHIIISVPDGEEIAKKTLNPRLGIIGGISILGTRGIVVPFSTAAYKASIVQAMNVARLAGHKQIVLTTGGRSEKYAMRMFPEFAEEVFVEMGDFVGFSLKEAKRQQFEKVFLVGMMGKFSKVAQGVMMVHAKSAPVDFHFLAEIAREAGADERLLEEIRGANTASQVGDMMREQGLMGFFDRLAYYCCKKGLEHVNGGLAIETRLTTLQGEFLGMATIERGSL
jgi:cobalt-precorrin-5B (C1)-methyltransferase